MPHDPNTPAQHTRVALPIVIAASIAACVTLSPHAVAQLGVPWSTVDGGGGISTNGTFQLSCTIGQADAGPGTAGMASGATRIVGGFWCGGALCRADFNNSGGLEVQDIFDFLNAWFALNPRADFNGVGSITPQDIFDFLAAWFAGCS